MKFLFCGLGSIGKRHIKNIKKIVDCEVYAFRNKNCVEDEFAEKYNIKIFNDFNKSLNTKPDAVFITNPTSLHMQYALKAAEKNCHLFIEKPISNNLDRIDGLIELVNKKQLTAMVGCNFRFHKGIRLIKEMVDKNKVGKIVSIRAQYGNYLPNWHPWEDYRQMYFSKESLGGGVVLDLIHEMDYIYWILGRPREVFSYASKLSNMKIETEDFAEILLRYDNGQIVNIHLDCIQRMPIRNCRIIGETGTILWDFFKKKVAIFSQGMYDWNVVNFEEYDHNDMYIEEVKHFLSCLEQKERPLISLIEAKDVLKIALSAKESSRTGKIIALQ